LRANAVEFLDNVLGTNLKRVIIPIAETPLVDSMISQTLHRLGFKLLSETECFEILLSAANPVVQMQILALIERLKDDRYVQLVGRLLNSPDPEVRVVARNILKGLGFSHLS